MTAEDGIGDPYYPADGNPGYNVSAYHVVMNYLPQHFSLSAVTTVHARASQRLTSFHLDLDGLRVEAITVDGRRATWTRSGEHELVVKPARAVRAGHPFTTRVTYRGKLHSVNDGGAPSGFIRGGAASGAGYLEGEPHGCATWFPCNDHPTDKARFSLAMTLPRRLDLVSVGDQGRTTSGSRHGDPVRTFRWRLTEPTATYMVGWYADDLTFRRSRLADGTKVISAYGPHHKGAMQRESHLPEILRVLARRWGPYPAPQAGGMFVDDFIPYELETYTRPVYSTHTSLITIVHENGHQWWGDNIAAAPVEGHLLQRVPGVVLASGSGRSTRASTSTGSTGSRSATVATSCSTASSTTWGRATSSTTRSTSRASSSSTRCATRWATPASSGRCAGSSATWAEVTCR